MRIQLCCAHIYLANQPVDFRKSINGLTAIVVGSYEKRVSEGIYIFYNRHKNKLKLLSYHRNGSILVYKQLHKKKFTVKASDSDLVPLTEAQLSWLLAGLDWVSMSEWEAGDYSDYY